MRAAPFLLGIAQVWATFSQVLGASASVANHSAFAAWNSTQQTENNSLMAVEASNLGGICSGDSSVAVRISTCFTKDDVANIDNWIRERYAASPTYYYRGWSIGVKYVAELAEHTSDSLCPTQAEELTQSDLAQSVSFMSSGPADNPDAVITFVKGQAVLQDPDPSMPMSSLTFRFCETCMSSMAPDEIAFSQTTDLQTFTSFPFNEIALCAYIPNSVTTAIGDSYCMCDCGDGKVMSDGACVVDATPGNTNEERCLWDRTGAGYMCEWGEEFVQNNKKSLKLVRDCSASVLVPGDNYVADKRVNANDGLAEGARESPMIKVEVTDSEDNKQLFDYTWKGYLSDPASSLDEIEFTDFGLYSLTMTASDYKRTTTCVGCVAVVDMYPPRAIESCRTSDFGTVDTPTDLTSESYGTANWHETLFYSFSMVNNIQNNVPNQLANDEKRKLIDYFETSEKDVSSLTEFCFGNNIVKDLLDKDASRSNPLKAGKTDIELDNLMCKRCCNKKTVLQEEYIDYKCGQKRFDKLIGVGDSCSFQHCMSIGSSTLVETTAGLVSEVNKDAVAFIAPSHLYTKDTNTMIYRLSGCSGGIGTTPCSRVETLSALIDIESAWKATIPGPSFGIQDYDVEEYVFWRYRINAGAWNLWSDTASYSFTDAETDITLEAWTACGKVAEFTFTYALFAKNSCNEFNVLIEPTADLVTGVNTDAVASIATTDLYTKGTNIMIHRLSTCSTGVGTTACGRIETLSALINVGSEWIMPVPDAFQAYKDPSNGLIWQYSINSGVWALWSNSAQYFFKDAETDIAIQMVSRCGSAKFTFTYVLYANPHVCGNYIMAVTNTDLTKTNNDGAICAYSGSDFAPVLLSITRGANTRPSYDTFECSVQVAEISETDFSAILPVSMRLLSISPPLHAYFGVALTTDGVHKDSKKVQVICTITDSYFADTPPIITTCSTTFTIKECTEAANSDGTCSVEDCDISNSLGKNDVCGGTIYQATTDQKTQVKPAGQCCPSCGNNKKQLTCSDVKDSPNTKNGLFKQCVMVTGNSNEAPPTAVFAEDSNLETSSASVVLYVAGGSALLGLVALIVLKRRAQFAINSKDDVYQALLD